MDYMVLKKVMSWKEAWDIYFVQNGGSLFSALRTSRPRDRPRTSLY